MKVSIFHCGGDLSYLYGLVSGLIKNENLQIDIIDSDQSIGVFDHMNNVRLFNFLSADKLGMKVISKVFRVIRQYLKTLQYVLKTDSKIIHVQWFNKFYLFDMTFMLLYYKLFGKKIINTAHNVNYRDRNNNDSSFNRAVLRFFYKNVNHIIVHNKKSMNDLTEKFNVPHSKISVIKLGLNIFSPNKGVNKSDARKFLNISEDKKVLLFFGALNTYKGLEVLINSFSKLYKENNVYHLIIAGSSRNEKYFKMIQTNIKEKLDDKSYSTNFSYIPDNEVEYYFQAADCLILPYLNISQSGVHGLSYTYGLPIIASDVGSFKSEDILEGQTGFICNPNDDVDLLKQIKRYFESELYLDLENKRDWIRKWAQENYSWDSIANKTINVYKKISALSK